MMICVGQSRFHHFLNHKNHVIKLDLILIKLDYNSQTDYYYFF